MCVIQRPNVQRDSLYSGSIQFNEINVQTQKLWNLRICNDVGISKNRMYDFIPENSEEVKFINSEG